MNMLSLTFFMALFALALDWARVKDTSPKTILKLTNKKKNKKKEKEPKKEGKEKHNRK